MGHAILRFLRAAEADERFALEVEGDLRPHVFFLDDTFVLSTSARLSREIISTARSDGAQRAMRLPEATSNEGESAGRLVAYGRVTGQAMGELLELPLRWIERLTAPPLALESEVASEIRWYFEQWAE